MDQWQSPEISELAKAIVKAQTEMTPAVKASVNPFFKSKYADLSAVWAAIAPFTMNGIAITQLPQASLDGSHIVLATQLTHAESGQWMRSCLTMPVVKNDPQGFGSALTYARRYALGCMTGLVTEEDDDGNSASHPPNKPVRAVPKPAPLPVQESVDECVEDELGDQAAFVWNVAGKHLNESVATIPASYLDWFSNDPKMQAKYPAQVEQAVLELDRRRA